jgi:hypothetical protein
MSNQPVVGLNEPNRTDNFLPINDGSDWEKREYPFLASSAIEQGTAVGPQISGNDVTGNLTVMGTENAAGNNFIGILADEIRSTDDDYADAGKLKAVWVPTSPRARALFKPDTGSLTAADVFRTVEFGADSKSLNIDTAGLGAQIVAFRSATLGECEFNLPNSETA